MSGSYFLHIVCTVDGDRCTHRYVRYRFHRIEVISSGNIGQSVVYAVSIRLDRSGVSRIIEGTGKVPGTSHKEGSERHEGLCTSFRDIGDRDTVSSIDVGRLRVYRYIPGTVLGIGYPRLLVLFS